MFILRHFEMGEQPRFEVLPCVHVLLQTSRANILLSHPMHFLGWIILCVCVHFVLVCFVLFPFSPVLQVEVNVSVIQQILRSE